MDVILTPNVTTTVNTCLSCTIPEGLYISVACHISLAATHLSTEGGVIDNDYLEKIRIILQNHYLKTIIIPSRTAIAQAIFKQASKPQIVLVNFLSTLPEHHPGFDSTNNIHGKRGIVQLNHDYYFVNVPKQHPICQVKHLPFDLIYNINAPNETLE